MVRFHLGISGLFVRAISEACAPQSKRVICMVLQFSAILAAKSRRKAEKKGVSLDESSSKFWRIHQPVCRSDAYPWDCWSILWRAYPAVG
jgi:hypothetical protein